MTAFFAPTTDIWGTIRSTRGGCCPVLSWFHPTHPKGFENGESSPVGGFPTPRGLA